MNTAIAETREVFKSNVATLRYNPDYKLIYLVWDGNLTLEKYKEPFLFLLNDFKPQIYGVISDIRKQSVVGPEMRKWLQNEATPKAKKRGLKCYYAVSEMNAFKQYYVNTVFKLLAGDGVDRKLFKELDQAEQAMKSALSVHLNNSDVLI